MLDQNHASFGCDQAYFIFGITKEGDSHLCRLMLVEASNAYAVYTIEKILLNDGKVSKTCYIISVHRDCKSIGIRSDVMQQIRYVDFMIDMVDPGRIVADPTISTSFKNSLSPEEREYTDQKIEILNSANSEEKIEINHDSVKQPITNNVDDVKSQLEYGLIGMGFKKSMVKKCIDGLKDEIQKNKIEDLFFKAILVLSPQHTSVVRP
jgi:hypothetical protein